MEDYVGTGGGVLDHVTYDSFGNITSQTNSTYADRFLFAGMEYDSTTGLYYDHARYYDSVTGRFVSQDPMGFEAGDTNLYRYVKNQPTNSVDPSGKAEPGWVTGAKRLGVVVFLTGCTVGGAVVGAGGSIPTTGGLALGPGFYIGGVLGGACGVKIARAYFPTYLPPALRPE